MKLKLLALTKSQKTNSIKQLEKINISIELLKELILKIENNTLTDDELYNNIINLYHIGEGAHGKTEILLNSNKYKFQYLKTNITITNKLRFRNTKTNEITEKTIYYPCILKVALINSLAPNHNYTKEEILNLIKTRKIVLWDIVWPTTTFSMTPKYTKEIKEGYTDLELYKCIYPDHKILISKKELDETLNQYNVSNSKMSTLKKAYPKQYQLILEFLRNYFTIDKLKSDKIELELYLKKILINIKDIIPEQSSKQKYSRSLKTN